MPPATPLCPVPLRLLLVPADLTRTGLFAEVLGYSPGAVIRARPDLVPFAIAGLTRQGTSKVHLPRGFQYVC